MSKLKGKLARRIMAIVLSGAMVMSNMSAYAAELAPETGTEVVSEAEENAAAESTADTAEEQNVSATKDESVETESSVAESSENTTTKAETEETKTENDNEAETKSAESTVVETEADSAENKETETEKITTEEATVEETTVEADLKEGESTAYEQGEWVNNQRTTKWDFTVFTKKQTLNATEPVNGLLSLEKGLAEWKSDSNGHKAILSIQNTNEVKDADGNVTTQATKAKLGEGDFKLAIPLSDDTISVDMAFTLGSKSNNRMIGIGDGSDWLAISHNPKASEGQKVVEGKASHATTPNTEVSIYTYSTKENNQTLAFETRADGSKWLYVIVGDTTAGSTGETKFRDITIIETKSDGGEVTPPDRGSWDDVVAPEIADVTYDVTKKDATISVKVKGVIDKTGVGADKLTVAMYDTNTITDDTTPIGLPVVKTDKTEADATDKNHYSTVTFTPTKSGTYYFKATLERSVESDGEGYTPKSNSDANLNEKKVEFKLPLKTPTISTADLKESTTDTITVGWNAVEEATYYEIAMRYSDEANSATTINSVRYVPTAEESSAKSFSKDIAGLVAGSTVKVTVQAFRGNPESTEAVADIDKSEVSGERTITLEEVVIPEGTKVFEAKDLTDADVLASADLQRIALTKDNYFVLVARSGKPKLFKSEAELAFDDGYTTPQCMAFGGNWNTKTGNWIEITTTGSAEIKVWWQSGKAEVQRSVALYDSNMTNLKQGTLSEGETLYIDKFEVSAGGTYRIASSDKATDAKNDIRIAKIEVKEGVKVNKQYTFDGASAYTADIAAGTYKDGDAVSFVDNYFTVLYSAKSKVEKKSYTGADAWADEYGGGYRVNFGGNASTSMNAIKFTTNEQEATVKVWWKAGGDGRHVQILGADGNPVEVSKEESKKDASYITKFKLTAAGTYYLGNAGGNNYLFKVNVTEGHVEDPVAWESVSAPVIKSAVQEKDKDTGKPTKNISLTFAAFIDEIKGCEKVIIDMYGEDPTANKDAEKLATASSAKTTTSADDTVTVSFAPESSGIYYFVARAFRAELGDSNTRDSAVYAMTEKFMLPLTTPNITRATNDGKGGMEIAYSETKEAEKYIATAVQVTKNEDGTYTPVEGAAPVPAESIVTPENPATTATFTGLEIGKYYAFSVHAVRGEDNSAESELFYKIVKDVPEQVWDYSAFGESTSTDTAQCGYSGDVNDGEVSVWSLGGKGKIVPASTDGVSFVYTKIDKDTNFVLEATACVDEWTYSNGQEGFGLMVADTVGPHGHGTKFWNNSFMAVATKIEYYWNGSTVLAATAGPADDRVRYNMYLGLGSIARTGVTDEWEAEAAAGATIPSKFVSEMLSLEHAAGSKGLVTGDYNIIGNAKPNAQGVVGKAGCIDVSPLTEIKLRVEKNNTGYFISYIDKNGEKTTHKYYEGDAIADKDYANQSLLQIDKDYMYVGFFAARNAKATFKDISFTTSRVEDGGRPEEKPATYNTPNYTILSSSVANGPEYEILFNTNWNGTLSVKDGAGRELVSEEYFQYLENTMTTRLNGGTYESITMFDKFFECDYRKNEDGSDMLDENGKKIRISGTEVLKADVKAVIPIIADKYNENNEIVEKGVNSASLLSIGGNPFTITFTPEKSWHRNDDELQLLSSYDTSIQTLNVSYRKYGEDGNNIYVSPDGKATNDGTPEAPLDIFTAVKYVQPGQTIVLKKGTYSLKKVLTIERGVDGTAKAPIRMIAEPGSYNRENPFAPSEVVIDFNGVASGMTIAGDYWYFRGFDVTHSSDGNKGIQVSGSYNTLDQVNTYYNGNTGIQVNRYRGTDIDKSDDWPHDNLILNCTSYLNADSGTEDADGFAAKLTIGDRNVFDGCIAAYNADDGWDLFAKSESGPIGQVIIKNSVAFKNGYLLRDNAGNLNVEGTNEIKAGNGNGFKMGGESIKGYHMLLNSYSFYNKAKGIDANSCPDIQAYNSISFNNMGYNVAFYTGVASYTEHKARNVISFRTDDFTPDSDAAADQLKPVKGKDPNGVERTSDYDVDSNFFYRDAGKSANMSGKAVTADWFKSVKYEGIHTVTRNANGTINLGDFLALTDEAKADTSFVKLVEATNWNGFKTYDSAEGAADLPIIGGQGSNDDNAKVDPDKDTEGNITSGDDDTVSSTDTWTQEEFEQLDVNGNTLKILLNTNPLVVDNEGYYHMAYTGLALKPAVRVAYGINELDKKNYSVSYKNNTKAYDLRPGDSGFNAKLAPTVIIKGKGNYAGEYNLYFVIDKVDLASDKVVSADITTVATGAAQKINPVVTFSGKKLGAKDYEVAERTREITVTEEGSDPKVTTEPYSGSYEEDGIYYIKLNAAENGNFKGTKTIKVTVLSKENAAGMTPMSKAKVDKIPDQIYDGEAHEPAVSVPGLTKITETTDAEGHVTVTGDYDVAYYDNKDVGVASVVLTGYGKYYGTKTVTFKTVAKPFNVKDYSVSVKYNKKYYTSDEDYKGLSITSDGSAVTFGDVIVTVGEKDKGKRLVEGVDYTVSYKGNDKAGTASIVVKGMGDYKGSMKRSFKIEPFMIDANNITVEPIGRQAYAKGGVKPSVIVKVKATGKVISPKNYSVAYKNNNMISTPDKPATVSITGKKLLKGSWKDAQTFIIEQKNLRFTDIVADNVYYGTAKDETNNNIAYATKLAVKDGSKTLSLGSDYAVTYYYYDGTLDNIKVVFDYETGKLELEGRNKATGATEKVSPKALDRKDTIKYDGSNKTIYAVIAKGSKDFYTGYAYTSYKVVGKNDLKTAKIQKITTPEIYNDGIVAAPKLVITIQNRKLENHKYVKDPELKELALNEDYEIVSIKNNDKAGTATITVRGIGYYCGTNKTTFKINKKDLSAWDAYVANAVVENIVVEVEEADLGKYAKGFTFDDIVTQDEAGNEIKEASPLAKAAKGKIYMVGTKTSTTLEYGADKDFTVSDYVNNIVDASKLTFDEKTGVAYQQASATITATEAAVDAGRYTGSRTIQFTIKVKRTTPPTV